MSRGPARGWLPTGVIERPGPREAWALLMEANRALDRARGTEQYEAAEKAAQEARTVFSDALVRAGR